MSVTITGDTTSSVTHWNVDLDMTFYHPWARLDEFGFNLAGPGSLYTFSDFNLPYTPTSGSLNGSGNANFLLTLNDPSGNRYDSNNIYSLSFTLTKLSNFSLSDFTAAPTSCSNDPALGCNQLGVHLQALGWNGQGSGVAVGGYPSVTQNPVPEPASMVLLGSGAVAAALARRRRKVAA